MSKTYDVYINIECHDESKVDTGEDDCWLEDENLIETFDNLPDAEALMGACQQMPRHPDTEQLQIKTAIKLLEDFYAHSRSPQMSIQDTEECVQKVWKILKGGE